MIPLARVRELLAMWTERAEAQCEEPSGVEHDLARDVLTLADALATAEASIAQLRADLERADHERQRVESERDAMEEQRDTARSALDGLVAAVRAYLAAADDIPGPLASIDAGALMSAYERERTARADLEAALGRCP